MTSSAATPELPAILPDSLYAAMHRYRMANWGDGPEYAGLYEAIRAYALAAIAAATKQPRRNWIPYLSDRADGVRGHYAICRWNTGGYQEAWSLYREQWGSASEEVLTLEQAEKLLRTCKFDPVPEFTRSTLAPDRASMPEPQSATKEQP